MRAGTSSPLIITGKNSTASWPMFLAFQMPMPMRRPTACCIGMTNRAARARSSNRRSRLLRADVSTDQLHRSFRTRNVTSGAAASSRAPLRPMIARKRREVAGAGPNFQSDGARRSVRRSRA